MKPPGAPNDPDDRALEAEFLRLGGTIEQGNRGHVMYPRLKAMAEVER